MRLGLDISRLVNPQLLYRVVKPKGKLASELSKRDTGGHCIFWMNPQQDSF